MSDNNGINQGASSGAPNSGIINESNESNGIINNVGNQGNNMGLGGNAMVMGNQVLSNNGALVNAAAAQKPVLYVNDYGDEYREFNPAIHTREWQLRINLRFAKPEAVVVLEELRANCRKDISYLNKLEDRIDQGEIACIQLTLIDYFGRILRGQNSYNVGWDKPVQVSSEAMKLYKIHPTQTNKVELSNALEAAKLELERMGCPWWLIAKKIADFLDVPNMQDITTYQKWVDENRPNSLFWMVLKPKIIEMFGGSIHSSHFDYLRKLGFDPTVHKTLEGWKSTCCKGMADAGITVDQDFVGVTDPKLRSEIIKSNEQNLFILLSGS